VNRHYGTPPNRAPVAGGTVLAAPGWAQAANRYDIEAPAGVSAITVGVCRGCF
jgi:hypothetical protein